MYKNFKEGRNNKVFLIKKKTDTCSKKIQKEFYY